ncbi:MAG: hypothetical protein H7A01_11840 [Hahellaceae bacterium]|jgi:hypothetical protein|nr:hypothetical protein [Hahellaceae bacterium]MCP5209990.1 hypothetical protein [Hahellaceae bacterium]
MTVLLHPNKTNPERYRVWDRETNTQKYFPLTKEGKRQANEFEAKVASIKKARALSRDLAINRLFAPDGSVRGLKRVYRKRRDRPSYECLALYACHRQTELTIGKQGFEVTYKKAIAWLLEKYGLEETYEIRQMFKAAKRKYWHTVIPEKM